MKNKTLFILTILIYVLTMQRSIAQTPKDSSKYEIGLGQAELPVFKNMGFYPYPNISFKYKLNRNVIRSGITYFGIYEDNYLNHGIIGNIGYERRLFGPRIQMIVGADIGYYRHFREYGYSTSLNHDYSIITYFWGVGPILGGIYNLNSKLSIQTELGFITGYGREWFIYSEYDRAKRGRGLYSTTHRLFSIHLYYKFGNRTL
jgi:hypothetical protein